MQGITVLVRSTIGRKVIMGVSGLVMVGFVIGHLAGNLLVFSGREELNAYAEFLQHGTHGLVWIARGGLLAAVVVHIWAAVSLTRVNIKARDERYVGGRKNPATTYAARTMRYGGVILLLFIIYHLLHFTFGTAHPDFVQGDPYNNIVVGFSVPWVSGFYIVAMIALGLHLYHGAWSGLQTLGLAHSQLNEGRRKLAAAIAFAIVIGNCSIPIAVLTRVLEIER
jgi:succinate dehydrogenase / fumarate reductase cytochrome b subunit